MVLSVRGARGDSGGLSTVAVMRAVIKFAVWHCRDTRGLRPCRPGFWLAGLAACGAACVWPFGGLCKSATAAYASVYGVGRVRGWTCVGMDVYGVGRAPYGLPGALRQAASGWRWRPCGASRSALLLATMPN